MIEDQAGVAAARLSVWRRGPFAIAAGAIAVAGVLVAILLATGIIGGSSDPYCQALVRALPGHVPTTTEAAIDDVDDLTAVTPIGKDQQLVGRVLKVDTAIQNIGVAYSGTSGLAGLAEPSAAEVASYNSAVSQLRAYCG